MSVRLSELLRSRYLRGLLSSLWPGLGQLAGREYVRAALLGAPILVLTLAGVGLAVFGDRLVLASRLLDPDVLALLLAVQVAVLGVRILSVSLALRLRPARPGRGSILVVALLAFVIIPQAYAVELTLVAHDSAAAVFEPSKDDTAYTPTGTAVPLPSLDPSDDPFATPFPVTTPFAAPSQTSPSPSGDDGRLTVLLIGQDSGVGRNTANTDTMIVASLDPLAGTVSMLSIPRDTVDVPLPDGRVWSAKISSLAAWARHHPGQFPGAKSGQAVLAAALSTLTGVQIDYWAQVDLGGLVRVVNSVGGVDVNVSRAFCDPTYDEYGMNGFAVVAGRYHMNGNQALAYARIRHAAGESDLTRAARQQEVVVALRDRIVSGGLLNDPTGLLRSLGQTISTNVPPGVITKYAGMARSLTRGHVYSQVVVAPLVYGTSDGRGSIQVPNVAGIRALAARLFPPAGTAPVGFKPMGLDSSATGRARALPNIPCHAAPAATPSASPSASPSGSATPSGTPIETEPPTQPPTAAPTPAPTPEPTVLPTPVPQPTAAPSGMPGG